MGNQNPLVSVFEGFKGKFAKEKVAVGLNLGVSSIKMVKVKFANDSVEVTGFSLEQNQLDMESVLKRMIQDHAIKRVNISVSGQQAITRYIDFPKMKYEELKQSIKFEAQKHIPFPVADVNLDAFILRDLADNKMKVLLAAVKKDLITQRLKLMQGLGLDVGVVDIDLLALINAFDYNYSSDAATKGKTLALLNIGSATSNLNILEDGLPALSRDISIGGNNFSQRVADVLNIDFKTAEETKTHPEKQKSDRVILAIEPVLAKLAQEVRTSFDFYESRSITSVEKIFLSGGGSLYAGLEESLGNLLGLSVEHWDPLRKISVAHLQDSTKIKPLAGQLAVAVGLALRG